MSYNFIDINDVDEAVAIIKDCEYAPVDMPDSVDEDDSEYVLSSEEMIREIAEAAVYGAKLDIVYKLRLLTKAWMKGCGVSLGWRTVVYELGAWHWERFCKSHEELKMAALLPWCDFFKACYPDYSEEKYGKYDIGIVYETEFARLLFDMRAMFVDEDTFCALAEGYVYLCDYTTKWWAGGFDSEENLSEAEDEALKKKEELQAIAKEFIAKEWLKNHPSEQD